MSNDVKVEDVNQKKREKIDPLLKKAVTEFGTGELSGFSVVWKQIGEVLGFEIREPRERR